MKITLKKGSVGGNTAPGTVSDPDASPPPVETPPPSETPVESSDEPSAEAVPAPSPEPLDIAAEGAPAVGSRRKRIDIFGIVFAVLGFLAIAVFVTLLILQGSEISFYKAPDSLWLK